ncbi:MAG: AraC family transcriptional regulator [Xenophilus sp.]
MSSNNWHYARTPHGGVEIAHWQGAQAPALRAHFHPQDQWSFVLRGSRCFDVGGKRIEVRAGEGLRIPAGLAHRSLAHVDEGTVCLNVYLPPARDTRAANAWTLTDREWREPVERIAHRLGLSREAFTRRFRARTGMPPHAWRLVERLNLARERLHGDDDLAALAAELGFADQSHLSRHFRRVFGVSPGRYRRGMRHADDVDRPPSQTS